MKIHKKIGLIVASVTILSLFGLLTSPNAQAAAPTLTDAETCEKSLRFVDIAHIVCDTVQEKGVTFRDRDPTDGDDLFDVPTQIAKHGVVYHDVSYLPVDKLFCDPGAIVHTASFSYRQGLSSSGADPYSSEDASKPITMRLNIGYSASGTDCTRYGGSGGKDVTITAENTKELFNLFQFEEDNIVSLDSVDSGPLKGKSYSLVPGYKAFVNDDYKSCKGEVIITKASGGGATGISYVLKEDNAGINKDYPELADFMSAQGAVGRGVERRNSYGLIGSIDGFGIRGTPPDVLTSPGAPGSTTGPGSVTGDNEACYKSGWELSWVACPVITAAQGLANTLYNFVEDQLKFRVEDGKTKDSLGDQREEVKKAWNNFRILVSGLVVILMLVMVISQAIGGGLFDAYTVKKMLPRLVIGVILIQLSWPIFSWVINTVDDLGRGLADIMYAPFGGAKALDLPTIMGPFTGGTAETFSWVGVGALVATGVIAPFLVIGLILTVLVAIFAAFLTLLFRKILIILALIFVPVALIAWMMPNEGLRIYWKKWWENFIKALMMFPLIILIIAGGRIFAKIGSGSSDFVGFFIVLVGFFGPLFILPKTFKWGGTVMSMAGQKISDARVKALSKPKEYLKKQQEGYSALRDARSSFRYNNPDEYRKNAWARTASLWRRPIDTFKAGGLNPILGTPGSELRARQRAAFVARGDKYETEQRQEAAILREKIENRLNEEDPRGGNKDDMYQDMLRVSRGLEPLKHYYDTGGRLMDLSALMGRGSRARNIMRRAALDRIAELGAGTNWRHVEAEHERITTSGTAEERTAWRKFLNDNKTIIIEKMPDLLKGVGSVSDISAEGISRMHGIGIERILSKTHADATEGMRAGESQAQFVQRQATGQARLTKFLNTYNEALNNSNLRGNLEQNGLRAVKAFVTSNPEHRRRILYDGPAHVHDDREDGRMQITAMTGPSDHPVGTTGMGYVGEPLLDPVVGAYPIDGRLIDIPAQTPGARSSSDVVSQIPPELRQALDDEINVDGSFQPPTPRGAQAGGGGGATGGITWRPPRGSSTTPI